MAETENEETQFFSKAKVNVLRELAVYLKPHKKWVMGVLASLVIVTIIDVAIPVVIYRGVMDEHILVFWHKGQLSLQENEPEIGNLTQEEFEGNEVFVGQDSLYIRHDVFPTLGGSRMEELYGSNLLNEERWYLFKMTPDIERHINEFKELFFFESDGVTAISQKHFDKLPDDTKKLLRAEDYEGINNGAKIYLLLLILAFIFAFGQIIMATLLGQSVMVDIRHNISKHLLNQSLDFFGRTPVGSLVSRVASDVETINELFANVATAILKNIFSIAGVLIAFFFLDVKLALIAVGIFIPVVIITLYFKTQVLHVYREVRSRISALNAFVGERIGGMSVIQMFAHEKVEQDKFNEKSNKLFRASYREIMLYAIFRPIINGFSSLTIAVILFFGGGLHEQGGISLGVLLGFIALVEKLFHPIVDLTEKFTLMQSSIAGGERIFQVMKTDDSIVDSGTFSPASSESITSHINFHRVSFEYRKDEPVLKNLSFQVNPGETIAIVGATGSGKSTIFNLLTRLWDKNGGSIRLGQREIEEYTLKSLRQLIQPVQQDVFLFSGTIMENITLGSNVSTEEAIAASEIVLANRFIEKLPLKYETMIIEGGENLSNGERQLLSFARLLAHKPKVILLDEATSNIDTETESFIQESLKNLLSQQTSLVIAHRLSTIRDADRILVIGDGGIEESGTHTELMRSLGIYYNLYQLQFKD